MGKPAPPRPRTFGGEQLVEHRLPLHPERLAERAVAADRLVLGELRQVAGVRVLEEELPKPPSRSSLTIAGTSSGRTGSR